MQDDDSKDAVIGASLAVRDAHHEADVLALALETVKTQALATVEIERIRANVEIERVKTEPARGRFSISPGLLVAGSFALVVVGGTLVLMTLALAIAAPAVAVSTVVVWRLYREAFPQRKKRKA